MTYTTAATFLNVFNALSANDLIMQWAGDYTEGFDAEGAIAEFHKVAGEELPDSMWWSGEELCVNLTASDINALPDDARDFDFESYAARVSERIDLSDFYKD